MALSQVLLPPLLSLGNRRRSKQTLLSCLFGVSSGGGSDALRYVVVKVMSPQRCRRSAGRLEISAALY